MIHLIPILFRECTSPARSKKGRHLGRGPGFTLVELLVVMAIIALLVGVSLGFASSALRSAQTAKCSSNMRQVGLGLQAYLTDSNNIMPQRIYGDGTPYFVVLAPYTGNNTTDKSTSVFVCPAHSKCDFPAQPSYGMNWYYDNTSAAVVQDTSTTIMVAESDGTDGSGSNRADQFSGAPGEIAKTRHSGSANYLFFDGHVEKLQWSATQTPVNLWGIDYGNHNVQSP